MRTLIKSLSSIGLVSLFSMGFAADKPDLVVSLKSYHKTFETATELVQTVMPPPQPLEVMFLQSLGNGTKVVGIDKNQPIQIKFALPEMGANQPKVAVYVPIKRFSDFKEGLAPFLKKSKSQLINAEKFGILTDAKASADDIKLFKSWVNKSHDKFEGVLNVKLNGSYVKKNADQWIAMMNMFGSMMAGSNGAKMNPFKPYVALLNSTKNTTEYLETYLVNDPRELSFNLRYVPTSSSPAAKSLKPNAPARKITNFSSLKNSVDAAVFKGRMNLSNENFKFLEDFYAPMLEMSMNKEGAEQVTKSMFEIMKEVHPSDMFSTFSLNNKFTQTFVIHKAGFNFDKIMKNMEAINKTTADLKIGDEKVYEKSSFNRNKRKFHGVNIHSLDLTVNFDNDLYGGGSSNASEEQILKMFKDYNTEFAQVGDFFVVSTNSSKATDRMIRAIKEGKVSKKESLGNNDLIMNVDLSGIYGPILSKTPGVANNPMMAQMLNTPMPLTFALAYEKEYRATMGISKNTLRSIGQMAMLGFMSFSTGGQPGPPVQVTP